MTEHSNLTLRPVIEAGRLRPKGRPEIAFDRVLLELRNGGGDTARGIGLQLEARQGPDAICELDEPLGEDLGPGAVRSWDLYDLFLEKGHGFPSKVHLFGIKAALGWDFTVRAEVRGPAGAARAAFRFTWSGDPAGPVHAAVEELP